MSNPRRDDGHRRSTVGLIVAVSFVAACASATPAPSASASVASGSASGAVGSLPSLAAETPFAPSSPRPDPYAGIPVVDVAADLILLPDREVGYLGATKDSLWAATSGGLVRIDPKTLRVDSIDHAGGFGLATTANGVWTTNFDAGTVSRLDPAKKKLVAVAEIVGNPNAISIFEDAVWVTLHRRGAVARLQAASGKVVSQIDVGPGGRSGPQGVAADADAVWVGIPNNRSVVRVDPATNAVVATIETTTSPCGGIAVQPDSVWVSSCSDDRYVIRIDPRTNLNMAEIDVGGNNGGAIIVAGHPWIPVRNRLIRVDPATNRIDRILQFAESFQAFGSAVGFGSVFVGSTDGQIARIPLAALQP